MAMVWLAAARGRRGKLMGLTRSLLLLAVVGALLLAGTGSGSGSPPRRASSGVPCGVVGSMPARNHVVWFIFENHSFSQIIGNPSAPYLNQLASRCGLATRYYAVTHP